MLRLGNKIPPSFGPSTLAALTILQWLRNLFHSGNKAEGS